MASQAEIARLRATQGLPPDSASDRIWVERINSGQATLAEAQQRITGKAQTQQTAGQVAEIRRIQGLEPDPESDQIWVERIASGQATLAEAQRRIAGKAGATAPAVERSDARARLAETLEQMGLGSLTDWAWAQLQAGVDETIVLQQLRERPEYQARFPAIAELRARGRAISEGQYIQLERSYAQTARLYGLPQGFYDGPEDFAGFIAGEVSPQEFDQRLALWRTVADQRAADPENRTVLDELGRLYGISPDSGEWLALVIDTDRALPALQRQMQAARTSSIAANTGFGQLTTSEADRLAGLSPEAASEGFGQLTRMQQLFSPLPGRGRSERIVTRQQQLGAAFDADIASQQAISRQQRLRTAEFEGGGGFVSNREGLAGAGRVT